MVSIGLERASRTRPLSTSAEAMVAPVAASSAPAAASPLPQPGRLPQMIKSAIRSAVKDTILFLIMNTLISIIFVCHGAGPVWRTSYYLYSRRSF